MLYLDTSALLKLCHPERETTSLRQWLVDHQGYWVTSVLTEVELVRAATRVSASALAQVPGILARCDQLEIDDRVRADAAVLSPPELRSLDAIHLATALELTSELEAVVTYDKRLATSAAGAGLTVETPT